MRFDLETDAPADKLESLIKLTERYCVVYQTLSKAAEISVLHILAFGTGLFVLAILGLFALSLIQHM